MFQHSSSRIIDARFIFLKVDISGQMYVLLIYTVKDHVAAQEPCNYSARSTVGQFSWTGSVLPQILHNVSKRQLKIEMIYMWYVMSCATGDVYVPLNALWTPARTLCCLSSVTFCLAKVGVVRRVIMGLDRVKKSPCGFCFVE